MNLQKASFEVGRNLTTPTDTELCYIARHKAKDRFLVTIREITKYKLSERQTENLKRLVQFLSDTAHCNLLSVWGLFWDNKNVFIIQEPVTDKLQLGSADLASISLQMVDLYEFMQEQAGYQGLQVRPDCIALRENTVKVFQMTLCPLPQFLGDDQFQAEISKFARCDLWDLGLLVYFLSTGQELIAYNKDTSYVQLYQILQGKKKLVQRLSIDQAIKNLIEVLLYGEQKSGNSLVGLPNSWGQLRQLIQVLACDY